MAKHKKKQRPAASTAATEAKPKKTNYRYAPWHELGWKEKYFSMTGRLDRKRYVGYTIVSVLYFIFIVVLAWLAQQQSMATTIGFNYLSLAIILAIPTLVFSLSINIRRWHDIGKPTYFVVLSVIGFAVPILCIIVWAYLFYKDGDTGKNDYGYPLPKD